jgi:parallel beta-helix repeat protein
LALIGSTQTAWARTLYVNPISGLDSRTRQEAQDPGTPWKTVRKALEVAGGNPAIVDTVVVQVPAPHNADDPVPLAEPEGTIESKRDGAAGAPITIVCEVPRGCLLSPPAGTNGFFVSHNHHVIDGFKVVGANIGIRVGPHDGSAGPVFGGIVQNNLVQGASSNGVQCANCQGVEMAFNTVRACGQNGIRYIGTGDLIHDNVVRNNTLFGIYVEGEGDHHVIDNIATGNNGGGQQIQIIGTHVGLRTFYVGPGGNDGNDEDQAQNPGSPWRTIQRGLNSAAAGDTLVVLPGTYGGAESRRDGTATAPISVRAEPPGEATVQAGAATSGFVVGHHHHIIEGFRITGSLNGIQMGPHEVGEADVEGLVAASNVVHDNAQAGIKFSKVNGGVAMHNQIFANGGEGIAYGVNGGNNAIIFNNLVYGNANLDTGKYGIALSRGSGHRVTNNTVHGNAVGGAGGGVRIGVSSTFPVFATVTDNIISGNPVGVKEPGGAYTGVTALDFNNVVNNGQHYDVGAASQPGPNSINLTPGYVNAPGSDFRLRRTSQSVDKGSVTPDAAGLAGRTAFTDKSPDAGSRVDLGYHGTVLKPSEGTVSNVGVQMTFTSTGFDTLTVSARLTPGAGTDGLGLGTDVVVLTVGSEVLELAASGFNCNGTTTLTCSYNDGNGPVLSATFTKNGSAPGATVDLSVTAEASSLGAPVNPMAVEMRIGDDVGSFNATMRGTLVFP